MTGDIGICPAGAALGMLSDMPPLPRNPPASIIRLGLGCAGVVAVLIRLGIVR
ncbi:hypothetical protein [Yinghuangia seranimata]|uniref:hypothetical protein n=1 Tax=Yinghuangia seranimata TaxID=408067 RepID=UPI00248BEA1E|nr:hypothetical protein [Yinghuangia seranimata]MDI2130613.1 hypothetical protein [Yinghuangia seranimata]